MKTRRAALGFGLATLLVAAASFGIVRATHPFRGPERRPGELGRPAASSLSTIAASLDLTESALDRLEQRQDRATRLPPASPAHGIPELDEVRSLVEEYRDLPPGPERERLTDRLVVAHRLFAMRRQPPVSPFIAPLMRVVEDSDSATERANCMISLHGLEAAELVDWYERQLTHSDPTIRVYAVEGLAWIRTGAASALARRAIVAALAHQDAQVRAMAALCLGSLVKDPTALNPLRGRRRIEHDSYVLSCIDVAVRRLERSSGQVR